MPIRVLKHYLLSHKYRPIVQALNIDKNEIYIKLSYLNGVVIYGDTYDVKNILKEQFNCTWMSQEKMWKVRATGIYPPAADPDMKRLKEFFDTLEGGFITQLMDKMGYESYQGLKGGLQVELTRIVKRNDKVMEEVIRSMEVSLERYKNLGMEIAKELDRHGYNIFVIISSDFNLLYLKPLITRTIQRVRSNFLERYAP